MKAFAFLCAMALCMSAYSMDFNPSDHLKGGKAGGVVGNIPMEIGVDNTGAATFSIPIELPQGCGGLTPELSINYNSMGGNGMFGRGTELSGVSAIYRTAATRFVNGYERGVMFDSDDALCLDGQPIIRNADNPLKYHCRIGDVYDITADNADNPTRFTLRDGNGITKEFGLTENSRLKGTGTAVFAWLLEKVTDIYGNYYKIVYVKDKYIPQLYSRYDGVCIDRIEYSGNEHAGIEPQMRVKFGNPSRGGVDAAYHGDSIFCKAIAPFSISVYSGENLIKTYHLDYDYVTDCYLRSISMSGTDWDNRLNPIEFTWHTSDEGLHTPLKKDLNLPTNQQLSVFYGDFNGDALQDILLLRTSPNSILNFKLFQNKGNGEYYNKHEYERKFIHPDGKIYFIKNLSIADFNGDGRDDILLHGLEAGDADKCFWLYLSDGDSFYDANIQIRTSCAEGPVLGDLNGDGATDLAVIAIGRTDARFYLSQLSAENQLPLNLSFTAYARGPWNELHLGNFDGGPSTELLNLIGNGHLCYRVNETNRTLDFLYSGDYPNYTGAPVYTGDFNGDGKTDIMECAVDFLYDYKPLDVLDVSLCTGTGFITKSLKNYRSLFENGRRMLINDINGDGKDDIVLMPKYDTNSLGEIVILTSLGDGYRYSQGSYPSGLPFQFPVDEYDFYLFDIYGEGKNSLVSFKKKIEITGKGDKFQRKEFLTGDYYIHTPATSCENVITSISDCLGNKTTFEYERWTDYTNSPFIPVWEKYPYSGCSMPLPLVKKMSQSTGYGGNLTTLYDYRNARTHLGKMSFMGFEEVVTTKPEEKMVRNDSYMLDPDYGMLNVLSITRTLDGQRLQMEKNVYDMQPSPVGTIMVQHVANARHTYSPVNSSNYLTVKTGRTYDKWGNILTERVTTNDKHKQITTYTYDLKESLHWVHRPASRQVETSVSGSDSHIEKETYSYAGVLSDHSLQPSRKGSYFDGNETHREVYGYDTFGNCDSISTGITEKYVIKKAFSLDGRFCIGETYPLGYSRILGYDEYGRNISISSSEGRIDSIRYDSFGNEVLRIENGVRIERGRVWSNGINLRHIGTYGEYERKNDNSYRLSFFDSRGNRLCNYYEIDGKDVCEEYEYDNLNRLICDIPAYYSHDRGYERKYTYDDYGNLTKTTLKNGHTVNMEYDYSIEGISVTKSDDTGTSSYLNDHFGKLLWSQNELGQKVLYEYDSKGRCTNICVDSIGTVISYSVNNNNGMTQTLSNRDIGTITRHYDENNRLRRNRNGIGVTGFEYDDAGNIVLSLNRDYNFQYEPLPQKPSLLSAVRNLDLSYSHEYGYNTICSRLEQEIYRMDGSTYNFYYDYISNKYDMPSDKICPDGFKIRYEYSNDILKCIKNANDGSIIWKAEEFNALGVPTKCKFGNNTLEARYDYDGVTGKLLKAEYDSLMTIEYTIDKKGLVASRTDDGSKTIDYIYDKIGRLVSANMRMKIINRPNYPEIPVNPVGSADTMAVSLLSSADGCTIIGNGDLGRPIYSRFEQYYSYDNRNNVNADGGRQLTEITYADGSTRIVKNHMDYSGIRWNNLVISGINRISEIDNETDTLRLVYGENNKCIKSRLTTPDGVITRHYVSADYEVIYADDIEIPVCYIYAYGRLVGLHVGDQIYSVLTDHLGSVMRIIDSQRNIVASYSYSEWGMRTIVQMNTDLHPWVKYFNRGFCGHEHLPEFSLINMGARVYDPVDMRFLSPDPLVQDPMLPQNFNRYSYCLNDPINHTDPTGEFFMVDDFIYGFFKGLFKGGLDRGLSQGWKQCKNSFKITYGLLVTGSRSGWGRLLELGSRFTFELPQTLAGYLWSSANNTIGMVDHVGYWGGATAVTFRHDNWAFGHGAAVTLGNYISGECSLRPGPANETFQHEYGHYLQSQTSGWAYIFKYGIPSIKSASDKSSEHKYFWTETDANTRAYNYFRDNTSNFNVDEWNFMRNPTDGFITNLPSISLYQSKSYPFTSSRVNNTYQNANNQLNNIQYLVNILNIQ
ncbi:FG-GAP-like repeat-containing protein [uncultured Muribaculum sp.]|uniref:FG-GAP-like repeat-containing protein n=1 Tax=uncultured Muribaculum sp. TaxID=1918613 RepID=UPI0025E5C1C3|nr:FG-GAP-like repeat-containing protein [uncultured Muribaculum sp.]